MLTCDAGKEFYEPLKTRIGVFFPDNLFSAENPDRNHVSELLWLSQDSV